MLLVFWQAKTANDEYRSRKKPVIGLDSPSAIYILDNDKNVGKNIAWDEKKKKFTCSDKECQGVEVEVKSLIIRTPIKNYGVEPAIDLKGSQEITIGNKFIRNEYNQLNGNTVMPNQTLFHTVIISDEDLINAFLNKEKISIKYNFNYSDLSRNEKLFEYSTELIVKDKDSNIMSLMSVDSKFKDNR